MLLIDSRIGSQDLAPVLKSFGVPVDLCTLDYGDCAFIGNGAEGRPVPVGIELKKLNDILNCVTTGRFSGHQLPGLVQTYDEVWLVIEGIYRPHPRDGVLETLSGGHWVSVKQGTRTWMYRDLEHFLTTIEIKGGVRLRRSTDRAETARIVAGLYAWWQKDYIEHRAHLAMNRAHRDTALLTKPSFKFEVAACMPGLGYMKAGCAAGHFGSVREMVNAEEPEWRAIPGVGKVLATRIVNAVNEGSRT
jgi:ERCC4-type nuclease